MFKKALLLGVASIALASLAPTNTFAKAVEDVVVALKPAETRTPHASGNILDATKPLWSHEKSRIALQEILGKLNDGAGATATGLGVDQINKAYKSAHGATDVLSKFGDEVTPAMLASAKKSIDRLRAWYEVTMEIAALAEVHGSRYATHADKEYYGLNQTLEASMMPGLKGLHEVHAAKKEALEKAARDAFGGFGVEPAVTLELALQELPVVTMAIIATPADVPAEAADAHEAKTPAETPAAPEAVMVEAVVVEAVGEPATEATPAAPAEATAETSAAPATEGADEATAEAPAKAKKSNWFARTWNSMFGTKKKSVEAKATPVEAAAPAPWTPYTSDDFAGRLAAQGSIFKEETAKGTVNHLTPKVATDAFKLVNGALSSDVRKAVGSEEAYAKLTTPTEAESTEKADA